MNQVHNQKVVFKYGGKTIEEIEMRNDSDVHYRQVKFWLSKNLVINLLSDKITKAQEYNDKVLVYGNAIKKFGRW